jgi:ABC-type transport system substrate-binding protein
MVFDALYESDRGGNCRPCIASGYDLSADGREVTLHIARGVKFFDGSDCDADDVYTQMQYIADHKNEMALYASNWQFLEKAEKIDQYTVKLYLTQPFFSLEVSLSYTYLAKAEEIEQYGANLFSSVTPLNGTGRWKLERWVDGQYLKYSRNYDYWQGGDFSNVDIPYSWFIQDPTAQNAAFINGEIDYIDGVNIDLRPMLNVVSDQCKIIERNVEIMYYLQFKMDGTAPTTDQNLRYAIMHAIDREAFVSLMGAGSVMNDFYTSNAEGHQPERPAIGHNPELAKEYLAKSNYKGETLVLLSRSDIEYADSIITAMADYLGRIGIKTQVDMVDTASMNTRRVKGDYDIFLVNLATWDGNALIQNLVPRIVRDQHHHGYVNEDLNARIMAAFVDLNRQTRTEKMKDIGNTLYELQGPIVPVVQIAKTYCIRNGVSGLIANTNGGYIIKQISVDEAYLK